MDNQNTPTSETQSAETVNSAAPISINDRMFFTRDEVCEVLNVGRNKFYKMVNAGDLVARTHANRTVVLKQDIENYLNNLPKLKEQEPEADAA